MSNHSSQPLRTGELTEMVLRHYGAKGNGQTKYIGLTQVRAATGWADPSTADVMVMGNWPSAGTTLWGYEVKVSRADWLNEVKNPSKATPTKKYCNQWWLVISDKSFVKDGELPDDWGMMAVVDGKLKIIKKAPELEPVSLSHHFVASLLRSNQKESIPVDVHNDKMKDAVRDAEAKMKQKYTTLLEYVKFLNKTFGIKLEKSDWSDQWHAQIRQGSYSTRHFTQDQLIDLFKKALSEDLKDLAYQFERMRDIAEEVIELTGKKESLK